MLETHELLQKNAQLETEVARLFAQNQTLFAQNQTLSAQLEKLTAQVNWFQNQLFGQKSEKRFVPENPAQLHLGEQFQTEAAAAPTQTIKEHQRKKKSIESVDGDCQKLFFDETRVPVEMVEIDNPAIAGLGDDEYEVVGERVSYRLAQKPSACVILNYVRKEIKLKSASESEKRISFAPMMP